jgi:hypothetical protein
VYLGCGVDGDYQALDFFPGELQSVRIHEPAFSAGEITAPADRE